jgi:diguanylate cyclase (GGDEF)-like protein
MDMSPGMARRAAVVAAGLTLLGGAAACLAWLVGAPQLTRLVASSSTVMFNTALLFAVAGGGLLAGLRGRPWIGTACAAFTVLLAALTLAEYLGATDLGIDQVFVADPSGREMPGRMAPNTALAFVFVGLAMLFLAGGAQRAWTTGVVQMLSALVLVFGAVALGGYAMDLTPAFQWSGLTRMALYTAVGFVVCGSALMLAAVDASRIAAWHELPWLAATTGIGVAVLSALGWYALRNVPAAARADLADIVLAFGLLTAALLAGTVAQARALKRANAALHASEGQLQLLLDGVQTAVVVHGPDSAIRYANPAAAEILGLTRDQLLGKTTIDPGWRFLREDGTPMPVAEYPVSLVFARKAALQDYIVGVRPAPGRAARWVLVNAVPHLGPGGEVRLVIVSFVDFSQRQHQTQQLERLALSDSLTGLATRRHFLEEAARELNRARRGHALSLLMLDVDHFKAINDTHGHAVGDLVLVELALTVRSALRAEDLAGRIGGEEFAVLLPDADAALAGAIAERLRASLAAHAVPVDATRTLNFTVSIGVATLGPADADVATLMARADQALYAAKRAGRNLVREAVPATVAA